MILLVAFKSQCGFKKLIGAVLWPPSYFEVSVMTPQLALNK
jgi:hypothetical protein